MLGIEWAFTNIYWKNNVSTGHAKTNDKQKAKQSTTNPEPKESFQSRIL